MPLAPEYKPIDLDFDLALKERYNFFLGIYYKTPIVQVELCLILCSETCVVHLMTAEHVLDCGKK